MDYKLSEIAPKVVEKLDFLPPEVAEALLAAVIEQLLSN